MVGSITSQLDEPGSVAGLPEHLMANERLAFQGSVILGMGFTVSPDSAREWIDSDPRYSEVLFPYLNGDDLNSSPDVTASRWVINFADWPLEKAQSYSKPFEQVDRLVRPDRQRLKPDGTFALRKPLPQRWWQYADKRPALTAALKTLPSCIAMARVSSTLMPFMLDSRQVFSDKLFVIASSDFGLLALMSSSIHQTWALKYAATLGAGISYSPSHVFETFPFPEINDNMRKVGNALSVERSEVMRALGLGLTPLYTLVHDPGARGDEISRVRELHSRIDAAVLEAYGWTDLNLNLGHHHTSRGVRWTMDPSAQQDVLDRLLALNHIRHAGEVSGLEAQSRGVSSGKPRQRAAGPDDQMTLELP
jgi:hypothetical protein